MNRQAGSIVKVWDPLVRIFHWSLVLFFAVSYLSGEEAEGLHVFAGYVIVALIIFRVLWGFVGSRHARFTDFVCGPGEETMADLLAAGGGAPGLESRVVAGRAVEPGFCSPRARDFSYAPYLSEGGIAGFETHKGCSARCSYCIEAGTPVTLRDPTAVVTEIQELAAAGCREFHLLDPEFNENIEHCRAFLPRSVKERSPTDWRLQAAPCRHIACADRDRRQG